MKNSILRSKSTRVLLLITTGALCLFFFAPETDVEARDKNREQIQARKALSELVERYSKKEFLSAVVEQDYVAVDLFLASGIVSQYGKLGGLAPIDKIARKEITNQLALAKARASVANHLDQANNIFGGIFANIALYRTILNNKTALDKLEKRTRATLSNVRVSLLLDSAKRYEQRDTIRDWGIAARMYTDALFELSESSVSAPRSEARTRLVKQRLATLISHIEEKREREKLGSIITEAKIYADMGQAAKSVNKYRAALAVGKGLQKKSRADVQMLRGIQSKVEHLENEIKAASIRDQLKSVLKRAELEKTRGNSAQSRRLLGEAAFIVKQLQRETPRDKVLIKQAREAIRWIQKKEK